MQRGVTMD